MSFMNIPLSFFMTVFYCKIVILSITWLRCLWWNYIQPSRTLFLRCPQGLRPRFLKVTISKHFMQTCISTPITPSALDLLFINSINHLIGILCIYLSTCLFLSPPVSIKTYLTPGPVLFSVFPDHSTVPSTY